MSRRATPPLPQTDHVSVGMTRPYGNGEPVARPTERVVSTERVPAADSPQPARELVSTIFQTDSAVRDAIADNMRGRSVEAKTFTARAHKAFADFQPTRYPVTRTRPNYVAPGESPSQTQTEVLERGVESFRNSNSQRFLKLNTNGELDSLIHEAPANDASIVGTIDLGPLLSYIEIKSGGQNFAAKPTAITLCKAELEAERRMATITHQSALVAETTTNGDGVVTSHDGNGNGDGTAAARKLVRANVDLQMGMATSPEGELAYAIPDRADRMVGEHGTPAFKLTQNGPTDVTSYHDFHNLQIAFEGVWTEVFDARVGNLGKQLYEEYVRLKVFSGVDDGGTHTINTIDDLRKLMDEIRDFARITTDSLPPQLQPGKQPGSGQNNTRNDIDTAVEVVNDILNPIGALIKGLASIGHQSVLTWDSFSSRLPDGDLIDVAIEPNSVDISTVEIVLKNAPIINWVKGLLFVDSDSQKYGVQIQDNVKSDYMRIPANKAAGGYLEFRKGKFLGVVTGVYLLGGFDTIKPGTRVTFTWQRDNL